jgi:hypothetical protein
MSFSFGTAAGGASTDILATPNWWYSGVSYPSSDIAISFWCQQFATGGDTRFCNLAYGTGIHSGFFVSSSVYNAWTWIQNMDTDGVYTIPHQKLRVWVHNYVLIRDGVLVGAWRDGVPVAITTQVAGSGAFYQSGTIHKISLVNQNGTDAFSCRMAEFGVWHSPIDTLGASSEIARLASGESPPDVRLGRLICYASGRKAGFDFGGRTEQYQAKLHDDPPQLQRKVSPRFLSLVHSATGPAIASLGTKLESGQALVINGGGFGTETGDAAVTISPANDIADAGAVVQTPTAWADGQITVASPTLTGMSDGDTVYVFVTDSAGTDSTGQPVQIADMVLRVGPPVATDDILDTDTGDPIASESLVKVAVMTTNLETVVATYLDASITSGKFEYDDDGVANITTEGDEFVVVVDGGDDRLGALRAVVVDRNED